MGYEFHTEILRNIAIQMKPAIYVELGVFLGETLNAVLPWVTEEAYACDIYDNFAANIPPDQRHKVHIYSNTRTDALAIGWRETVKKPIDLIFIDADHSKEAVVEDILAFLPFLKEDTGLMVLHDMWPPDRGQTAPGFCGDGYLLKPWLNVQSELEYCTLPLQYGVGIIRKIGKAWQNGY
jgi:hypothetical protein